MAARKVDPERYGEIIAMREGGMTYADIGRTLDPPLSKARVHIIVLKCRAAEKRFKAVKPSR